ncbi:MAG TPA: hypothetical protein VJ724_13460, partial [Tahibacter sp.]|nr:hypothetical protein [Tahibacter sp.]
MPKRARCRAFPSRRRRSHADAEPAAVHVALSNFYWYAGLFAPAVLHAKAAWSVNQFAVSTNMLIRIVAAAGRAALVTDDVHDSVAWMQHAREALPALYALPVTAKRLGTAASQLRREA